jgi:hypothetical protein
VLIFALLMGNFGLRVAADSSVLTESLDHTARIAHTEITFTVKAVFFTFMGRDAWPAFGGHGLRRRPRPPARRGTSRRG